jgi:hypothetical protein
VTGMHPRGNWGHPYRVPVKYKNSFSEPKILRLESSGDLSVSFCCLSCCYATLPYRNILDPSPCFAPGSSSFGNSGGIPGTPPGNSGDSILISGWN